MKEARFFYNGKTHCNEVSLLPELDGGERLWRVSEIGYLIPKASYPDTDEGYTKARADYERRVARRMTESEAHQ